MSDKWTDRDDQQFKKWMAGVPGEACPDPPDRRGATPFPDMCHVHYSGGAAPACNDRTIVSMSWTEFQKILDANESLAEEEAYLRISRGYWRAAALVALVALGMLYFLCRR